MGFGLKYKNEETVLKKKSWKEFHFLRIPCWKDRIRDAWLHDENGRCKRRILFDNEYQHHQRRRTGSH